MWLKFSSAGENEMWNQNLLHYYDCISVLCVIVDAIVGVYDNLLDDEHTSECKQNQSNEMKAHIHWHIFVPFLLRWLDVGALERLKGFILYGFLWRYFSFRFDSFDGVFYSCNQINFSFLSSYDPIVTHCLTNFSINFFLTVDISLWSYRMSQS